MFMHDERRAPRALATAGRPLPQSGMTNLLSSDQVPEPQGGRDVESQRIFDALQSRIFGVQSGPTVLGRWHLLARLGRGAMGTVYEAYDPKLDRKVAVKVLHSMTPELEAARRVRLHREAQAMARVKHPNLVEVYDVFADEPQPYVVMELVAGTTLRTWQESGERGWREVVRVYLEAARGLAALHAIGLVHRDFKPENAMVDGQGRVLVVDLGLVFAERIDDDQTSPPSALTRDGLLVGTLSYMSPEQLDGKQSDARSDVFGLCAALYEAVYTTRPYIGDTPETLLADIQQRSPSLQPNPRGAPRWLGRALVRGLAFQSDKRFPDMQALVAALERGLARRRQFALGVSLLAVVALAALSPQLFDRSVDPCRSIDTELTGVWDDSQEQDLRRRFLAQGLPQAEREWSHLAASIHASRDHWTRLRRQTCPELREATPAPSALQRSRCLEDALLFMKRLTEGYLEMTSVEALHARAVAAELAARIQRCAQISPEHAPPARPELDVSIQAALIAAEAEQTMGRLAQAQESAETAVALAEQTDLDVARAEALHRLGRIVGLRRRTRAALAHLHAASRAATRANRAATGLDADLFAAKLKIIDLGDTEALDDEIETMNDALIGLQRAGYDVRARRAELDEVRGFAARLRGQAAATIGHFARALRIRGESLATSWTSPCPRLPTVTIPDGLHDQADNPVDVIRALNNLAMATGEASEHLDCAESIYRRALALADAHLGALHPVSIDVRFDYSEHLGRQARIDEQEEILRPVGEASALQFGEASVPVADVLLNLATIAAAREKLAEAENMVHRAIAIYTAHCEDQICPANYGTALHARAELHRLNKDLERAVPAYEKACEQLARRGETAAARVECMYHLAEALIDLRRRESAQTVVLAAEPHFQRLESRDEDLVALRQRLNRENTKENKDAPSDRE